MYGRLKFKHFIPFFFCIRKIIETSLNVYLVKLKMKYTWPNLIVIHYKYIYKINPIREQNV